MTFDPRRDDARRSITQATGPTWRCGAGVRQPWSRSPLLRHRHAAVEHDDMGALEHGTNAPRRRRRHGPTVEDSMAAQFTHDLPDSAVLRGNSFRPIRADEIRRPRRRDGSSFFHLVFVLALHCRGSVRSRPRIGERSGETGSPRDLARGAISASPKAATGQTIVGRHLASQPG
jgi:hypothetical protein